MLNNSEQVNFMNDNCVKMLLKGSENISLASNIVSKQRAAMNLPLLQILGHRLANTGWHPLTIQTIWAAATVAFFTSCRMGEILAPTEKADSVKTLTWKNVVFTCSSNILIYLPFTKTTGFKGKFLDIFEIKAAVYCPVKAMKELRHLCGKYNMFDEKKPVFTLMSNKFLTVAGMNKILSSLLSDFTDENFGISCHSFRAAIPNLMSEHPEVFSKDNVKQWGNWSSDSYKRYTRSDINKNRVLFGKILHFLD